MSEFLEAHGTAVFPLIGALVGGLMAGLGWMGSRQLEARRARRMALGHAIDALVAVRVLLHSPFWPHGAEGRPQSMSVTNALLLDHFKKRWREQLQDIIDRIPEHAWGVLGAESPGLQFGLRLAMRLPETFHSTAEGFSRDLATVEGVDTAAVEDALMRSVGVQMLPHIDRTLKKLAKRHGRSTPKRVQKALSTQMYPSASVVNEELADVQGRLDAELHEVALAARRKKAILGTLLLGGLALSAVAVLRRSR